jgi:peptidoglycan-associated lipoprotein
MTLQLVKKILCFSVQLLVATVVIQLMGCATPTADDTHVSGTAPEPYWVYQDKPRNKVAVVFVHGLFGDLRGTWTHSNGTSFFDYLKKQPAGIRLDVFAFGFTSNMLRSGSLDIQEAANTLQQSLQYHKVTDYQTIVFVGHSMGGLVILRHLLNRPDVRAKVPMVAFYAVPQEGAQIAVIADKVANNAALRQMFPADANYFLQQLSQDWRSASNRPVVNCGYEKLPMHGVLVVPWSSSTRYCDEVPIAIEGADHSTIVKPDRPTHPSVVLLVNALNKHVLERKEARLAVPDFVTVGDDYVYELNQVQSWVRLVNEGEVGLSYSVSELTPPGLYIVPDDTPREIEGGKTSYLKLNLLMSAASDKYSFKLRGPGGERKVLVNVSNLSALRKVHAQALSSALGEIEAELADASLLANLRSLPESGSEAGVPIQRAVYVKFSKENSDLPPSSRWLLTADLMLAANWPKLAVSAIDNASQLSPETANAPAAKAIDRVAALLLARGSPESAPSALIKFRSGQVDLSLLNEGGEPFANTRLDSGFRVAETMRSIPQLAAYGASLRGDLLKAKGEPFLARAAYEEAAQRDAGVWIQARLDRRDVGLLSDGTAVAEVGSTSAATPVAAVDAPSPPEQRVVFFDFDSYDIKPEYHSTVEAHAKFLRANRNSRIVIEGHTDDQGNREYNLVLGQRRSEALRRALGLLGVSDSQIEAISFGREKPRSPDRTAASRSANRRAEITYRD